jgi:hypothetical protein
MRRILILLGVFAVCVASFAMLWIFRGREISSLIDRYGTLETESALIRSIAYEGSGTGGTLVVNDVSLSLNDVKPGLSVSVGSTKYNQLGLASSGRVFAFGPLTSTAENSGDRLAAVPPAGDQAFVATRHSIVSWPTPVDLNFMTGRSPSWKRHIYYEIRWKKSSSAYLEMLWRYEQFFYPGNGWANGFMTREGSTGLIRVEIKQ